MVHRIEELFDIELQRPARASEVFADLSSKYFETPHGGMRPLPFAAGIAIEDERTLEDRQQHSVNRMMHKSVAYCRFVDDTVLRIEDVKAMIRTVAVDAACQFLVQ